MENNDFTNVSVAEVTTWFYTVWLALSGDLERYVTAALEYRRVETEIYRSRYGKKFMTTPDERQRLLAAGLPLGDRIQAESWLGSLKRECVERLTEVSSGSAHEVPAEVGR